MPPKVGFYGKIPSRGDFVRYGLSRALTATWDGWMSGVLRDSKAILGRIWLDAWLEAPVWRFALPIGLCGSEAVLGLWMPSIDRAGRSFPLMLAAAFPAGDTRLLAASGTAWLDAADEAGRAALADVLEPETLAARVPAASLVEQNTTTVQDAAPLALWWTDGSPRVPPQRFALPRLPDAECFASMLDATRGDG